MSSAASPPSHIMTSSHDRHSGPDRDPVHGNLRPPPEVPCLIAKLRQMSPELLALILTPKESK